MAFLGGNKLLRLPLRQNHEGEAARMAIGSAVLAVGASPIAIGASPLWLDIKSLAVGRMLCQAGCSMPWHGATWHGASCLAAAAAASAVWSMPGMDTKIVI